MSVINQMLRDLDARGQGDDRQRSALAAAGQSAAVMAHRRPSRPRFGLLLASLVLMLVVLLALLGWMRLRELDAIAAPPVTSEVAPALAAMQDAPPPAPAPAPASLAPPPAPAPAPAPAPRARIERIEPAPPPDLLEPVRQALAEGQAEAALQTLVDSGVRSAEADALQAAAQQQLGHHTEAVQAYQRALRSEPDIGVWWAGLGISLDAQGRADEALSAFREAQRRGPLDPALSDYLGKRVEALSASEPPR